MIGNRKNIVIVALCTVSGILLTDREFRHVQDIDTLLKYLVSDRFLAQLVMYPLATIVALTLAYLIVSGES